MKASTQSSCNMEQFPSNYKGNEYTKQIQTGTKKINTVQITFIFIEFRVCDFAFAFKTQNAPHVSRFKRVLFSDRFQFAF